MHVLFTEYQLGLPTSLEKSRAPNITTFSQIYVHVHFFDVSVWFYNANTTKAGFYQPQLHDKVIHEAFFLLDLMWSTKMRRWMTICNIVVPIVAMYLPCNSGYGRLYLARLLQNDDVGFCSLLVNDNSIDSMLRVDSDYIVECAHAYCVEIPHIRK